MIGIPPRRSRHCCYRTAAFSKESAAIGNSIPEPAAAFGSKLRLLCGNGSQKGEQQSPEAPIVNRENECGTKCDYHVSTSRFWWWFYRADVVRRNTVFVFHFHLYFLARELPHTDFTRVYPLHELDLSGAKRRHSSRISCSRSGLPVLPCPDFLFHCCGDLTGK
jgi:hypothetical protein